MKSSVVIIKSLANKLVNAKTITRKFGMSSCMLGHYEGDHC